MLLQTQVEYLNIKQGKRFLELCPNILLFCSGGCVLLKESLWRKVSPPLECESRDLLSSNWIYWYELKVIFLICTCMNVCMVPFRVSKKYKHCIFHNIHPIHLSVNVSLFFVKLEVMSIKKWCMNNIVIKYLITCTRTTFLCFAHF